MCGEPSSSFGFRIKGGPMGPVACPGLQKAVEYRELRGSLVFPMACISFLNLFKLRLKSGSEWAPFKDLLTSELTLA